MNVSELKYQHETANPESFFFTRKTMNFFGDTMKNFRVLRDIRTNRDGERKPVYVLSRRRATKNMPAGECAIFDAETFLLRHDM